MKYVDLDKLIAEIERRIGLICTTEGVVQRDKLQEYEALRDIEDFVTSLQQEQPEVDEDFFFDGILKVYDGNNKYLPRSEEELTMLETVARHFYELGKARKEE